MVITATVVMVLLIIADQLIKFAIVNNFELFESVKVIHFGDKEIFSLTFIENDGASWGIFSGHTSFLLIVTGLALLAALVYMYKYAKNKPVLFFSLAVIIAGGIGNMIDRIFRNGKVIDYIDAKFIEFPIFNLADICVTVGGAVFVFYLLFFESKSNKKIKEAVND